MNTTTQLTARPLTAATLLVALAGLAFQMSGCSSARSVDVQAHAAELPVVVMPQVMVTAKRAAFVTDAALPVVQLPQVTVTARRALMPEA